MKTLCIPRSLVKTAVSTKTSQTVSMIETCVYYWDPQPRTLSRNTQGLLQDWTPKYRRTTARTDARAGLSSRLRELLTIFPKLGVCCVVCEDLKGKRDWCKTIWSVPTDPFCVCISFELQRPILWSDLFALPHARRRRYRTNFSLNLLFSLSSFSLNFNRANVRPIPEHLEFYLHFPTHCDGIWNSIIFLLFSD